MLLVFAKVYDCGFDKKLAGFNIGENPTKNCNSIG